MIKFLLILMLTLSLQASKILSYNIYERTDRVDVMITFDAPYAGVIKQNVDTSQIVIKLEDTSFESEKIKKLTSPLLSSLRIVPMTDYTTIVASVPSSTKLQASKTSDGYGLRLRFTKEKIAQTTTDTKTEEINPLATLPTKKDDVMQQSYYIVVTILILGILVLFFINSKVSQNKGQKWAWPFKGNYINAPTPIAASKLNQNVSIRFQKNLNEESGVVMLDFGNQSYLILMGKNNILLDKFTDNKPMTQEDFETILQNRHLELDNFMKLENTNKSSTKESLQTYKERAASMLYES